tara:strand:- start:306 stop:470 length:165 start_codon:yes stop_codon:yes gene_type:complete
MNYTLITSKGTVQQFYVKAVAELYQTINGGVIVTAEVFGKIVVDTQQKNAIINT